MSKMKEVAEILGVDIGEEFTATGIKACTEVFRITDPRFERITTCNEWVEAPSDILYDLLTGKRKIIKKPWKPKIGEEFFVCTRANVCPDKWSACTANLMAYAVGNCFRTYEEAEAHSNEILARLEKIYREGKPLIGADEWMKLECQ